MLAPLLRKINDKVNIPGSVPNTVMPRNIDNDKNSSKHIKGAPIPLPRHIGDKKNTPLLTLEGLGVEENVIPLLRHISDKGITPLRTIDMQEHIP